MSNNTTSANTLIVLAAFALTLASPLTLLAEWTITLRTDLPADWLGPSLTISCGVKQAGRLIDEWRWTATVSPKDPQAHSFTHTIQDSDLARASDPRGPADLFLCLNQDGLESFHSSLGDFFHRRTISLAEGAISIRLAGEWKRRTLARPGTLLTVHYHRFEGDYDSAGLWTWGEGPCRTPPEQEVFAVGRDGYGPVFQLDLADYGCSDGRIGLLPRLNGNWDQKDGPDRFWESSLGRDVYLLPADEKIYPRMPDLSPKLAAASLASEEEIILRFTHGLPVEQVPPARVALFNEGGLEVKIAGVWPLADGRLPSLPAVAGHADHPGTAATQGASPLFRTYEVRPAAALDIAGHTYKIRVQDYGEAPVSLGALLSDPDRYGDESAVIGATCKPQRTLFRLFAPVARQAAVVVADQPAGGDGLVEHPMRRGAKGLWQLDLEGDFRGKFYSFRLAASTGSSGEVADPAAVCGGGIGPRTLLVDPGDTNPPGFDPTKHPPLPASTDAIIYEMSVRDFTVCARSGVSHKGQYLGLTESGTHLEGDASVKTGLDHLVELGVTHVQLMPVQDFENDEANRDEYNWGYIPVLFSSPDGWFATNPVGDARIRELKAAVQALHDRGIAVTLDVVYNHTADSAPLEKIIPGYYYRLTEDGRLSNGSGCGNEFNSENPMARKLMLDSLVYWVKEFGIDGFRFDLMGLHAPETMLVIQKTLRAVHPEILIYGEPWTGGATVLPQVFDKGRSRGTGIAAFNDHFRDAIKGDRDGGSPGFIQVGDRIDGVKKGITGAIDDWALHPTDAIQYCEAHDNLTTWDKFLQSAGNAPPETRERMQRFAGMIVLTSQGIPFLHSGQELCRSKRGHHNSYNAPDEINRIDWFLKKTHAQVFTYYQGLIALRKAHPAFRLRSAEEVRRRLAFLEDMPNPRCIVYTLDGRDLGGESFSSVLVLMNGDFGEQTFAVPQGTWMIFADADRAGAAPLREAVERVTLPAHSGMVLAK